MDVLYITPVDFVGLWVRIIIHEFEPIVL